MIAGVIVLSGFLVTIVLTDILLKQNDKWENYGISSHFIAQMIAVLDDITKENKE